MSQQLARALVPAQRAVLSVYQTDLDASAVRLHQSDLNELHVSFSCLLLVLPYQLEMKPRLGGSGLTCPSNNFSLMADIVMDLALFYRVLALGVCCKSQEHTAAWAGRVRLSARVAVSCALMVVFLTLISTLAIHGACAFFEFVWHILVGWIAVLPGTVFRFEVPAHRARRSRRISLEEAEVRAAQILGELRSITCEDAVLPPLLQRRAIDSQCSICLGEWDALDTIKVTPCDHGFHQQCLHNWLIHQVSQKRPPSCVVCRQALEVPKGDKWAARR